MRFSKRARGGAFFKESDPLSASSSFQIRVPSFGPPAMSRTAYPCYERHPRSLRPSPALPNVRVGPAEHSGTRCLEPASERHMEATSSTAIAEPYREARHIRLMPGPRELAAIVAFWVGYALLTLANRIFDQGGPSAAINGRIIVAAVEAVCWMVLTPVLFALVGRFDLERGRPKRERWLGVLLIALVTVVSAALLGFVGRELREVFTPFQGRGPGGGGRGGPPPSMRLWFGFFNALVLALGVVATGVARAYSLRLRARRDQAIQLTSQLAEARLDALRRDRKSVV